MNSFEVNQALHEVRKAALCSVLATEYPRDSDPHADASADHADEGLALAARELVRAVEALPERDRPIGWDEDNAATRRIIAVRNAAINERTELVERLRAVRALAEAERAQQSIAVADLLAALGAPLPAETRPAIDLIAQTGAVAG